MLDRNKIIETLIDDEYNHMEYDYSSFFDIMANGFRGYYNFTDDELIEECDQRDISYLFGNDD